MCPAPAAQQSHDVPPTGTSSLQPAHPDTPRPDFPDPFVEEVFRQHNARVAEDREWLKELLRTNPESANDPEVKLLQRVLDAPPPVPVMHVQLFDEIAGNDAALGGIHGMGIAGMNAEELCRFRRRRRSFNHMARDLAKLDIGVRAPPDSDSSSSDEN